MGVWKLKIVVVFNDKTAGACICSFTQNSIKSLYIIVTG